MRGEARVGVEGRVDGVVREVEEEGLVRFHRVGDVRVGFECERLGEEDFLAVILVETEHRRLRTLPCGVAEVLLPVIARRRADGRAAHVDVEADGARVRTLRLARAKVAFADVDGAVAIGLHQARQRHIAFRQALPIPLRRAFRTGVVAIRVNPVRRAMPRGVLAGHDGNARG